MGAPGAGGNFAAVTSIRVQLHPIGRVLAGTMLFPWSEAESVFGRYAEALTCPNELSVFVGVFSAPDGSPVVCLAPMWSGEARQGEEFIASLRPLGTPVMNQIGPMNYRDSLGMFPLPQGIQRALVVTSPKLWVLMINIARVPIL